MKTFCPVSLLFQPGRESLGPVGLPTENCWFVDSFKWFYRGFVTRAEGRSDVAKRELNESLTNLSSVTTPNGPWVYTVVPWED
jgi:hypothetical protein